MENIPTHIPKMLDEDPPVLKGVTAPELYNIASISGILSFISMIGFGFFAKSVMFGMSAGFILFLAFITAGVLFISDYRRGKPSNFMEIKKGIILEKIGLGKAPFIHKTTNYITER